MRLLGASVLDLSHEPWGVVLAWIREQRESVWLVRAGAWPVTEVREPPPSATGLPLVAFGAPQAPHGVDAEELPSVTGWRSVMRRTGGSFRKDAMPEPVSVWLDSRIIAALEDEPELRLCLQRALSRVPARLVHDAGLDVHDDGRLRIAEMVTSAQRGGAERVALDLAQGLRTHGLRSSLVTLGRPSRAAFQVPSDAIDLSRLFGEDPDHRARRVARDMVVCGFDLIHGHLIDHFSVKALAARGIPLVLTLHNTRASWPSGMRRLKPGEVSLVLCCAQAVEKDARETLSNLTARTIWNGIDFEACASAPGRAMAGRAWRTGLGFQAEDFVLIALANPRPQKRLHLLPAILRATREALSASGSMCQAKLVIVGEASRHSPLAARSLREVENAIDENGVRDHVRLIGLAEDVTACLFGSDVLVSASAHEGLSLAQIEALACGRPVVTTNVGGASELAAHNSALFLLDKEASPTDFARVLLPLAPGPLPDGREIARRDFDLPRMIANHARLLPRALRAARRTTAGEGLWLITNNFSTGGAQTSARRLLLGLKGRGVRVRAAVVEEQIGYETPGRAALMRSGVPVLAIPDPASADAPEAVTLLLDAIDLDPPKAVLLWNVMPLHKILIADALLDVPVFDVSPGEMYFSSLERYLASPRGGLPYRSPLDYGRRLAGVIVKYEGERERARDLLGAPVHVISNGVPENEPADRRRSRRSGEPVIFGTAVRLDPRKHVDRLLRALRLAHDRLPPYVMRIAGGVERGCEAYVDELRGLASGLCVEFIGEVDDTRDFLQGLDIFALVAEPAGCPNASLEAMAAGLPVVATDVGGMAEQIQDGVTGRLVGRTDETAFASALVELARDGVRRESMGEAARSRAARRFGMAAMIDAYASVCDISPPPLAFVGPRG